MNVFKRAWFWVKNDRKCLGEYGKYLSWSTLLHVAYFMVLSLTVSLISLYCFLAGIVGARKTPCQYCLETQACTVYILCIYTARVCPSPPPPLPL